MSFCESMAHIRSSNVVRRKKMAIGHRQYFSLWKRLDSDCLRAKILEHLGYSSGSDAYTTFLTIPEVHPSLSDDYLRYRQASALFSKDEDMRSPIDKRAVAFQSFLDSEQTCASINEHLRNGSFATGDVGHIIWYAQRKIASILGDVPLIEELDLTFGSGASTSCRGQKVSARWKLSSIPSISESAVTALQALIRTLPSYFKFHKKVEVHYGRLDFVPKNYKTMRSICVEPTVNVMLQRGIGSVMKRKLLSAGVNLYDQSINRHRARVGSLTGAYSTIDLEKASDSVSYLLVMELLPWDWFQLLDMARTATVEYSGSTISLEKFSSMGNGFTFELESLIFYALAYGIARHFNIPFDLTVYGDDIVANPQLATLISGWFPQFGFKVNITKSYFEGPFRESCGGDFVTGVDVRPFYLKGRFTTHKVVCFYNFLCRKPQFDRDGSLRELLLSYVPLSYRLWGPDGYGDGHLLSDDPSHLRPYGRSKGYEGFTFSTFVASKKRLLEDAIGDDLLPAYYSSVSTCPTLYQLCDRKIEIIGLLRLGMLKGDVSSIAPDHFSVRVSPDDEMISRKVKIYVLGPRNT